MTVLTEIAILLLIEINIILLSTTELVEIVIPDSDGPFTLAVNKSLLEESKTKNKTKNKTKRSKRK